jgi:hypothetical protein
MTAPGRLIAAATRLMPPSRRAWGRTIAAELPYARSRAERARLVLATLWVVLLVPPSVVTVLRGYARVTAGAAALAVVAYLPIGLALYLFGVVFSAQFAVPVTLGYGYPLAVLLAAGARSRTRSARLTAAVLAGLVTGLVLAALTLTTVALLDHAFYQVISQRPDYLQKLRASGLPSMRAYLNHDLQTAIPFVAVPLAIGGVICAPIGAALAQARAARLNQLDN